MLFNSFTFIAAFLPVALLGYHLLSRLVGGRVGTMWLVLASLFFYGWWDVRYVPLLLLSIVVNYAIGTSMRSQPEGSRGGGRLVAGVTFNLALLGYFKYTGFLVANANVLLGSNVTVPAIVLPLAISFFSFQQIAYLVDISRAKARPHDFVDYCLFVTFFPQLIAGPIVHHAEMLPQFERKRGVGLSSRHLVVGLSIFAMGLFKKVLIADGMAVYASPVFDAAAAGDPLTFMDAWGGSLAYTFQLYFDFSGYSDMAIGLGRMFGIALPLNFSSPYKASSIIEFWRRWHITLSRFLRDYLYIPLGGSRRGEYRRYTNVFITMLLGGIWHGAGWTFFAWGALHGVYIVVNHLWRQVGPDLRRLNGLQATAANVLATGLTFVLTLIAWVFFRASDVSTASEMLRTMFGLEGVLRFFDPIYFDGMAAPAFILVTALIVFFGPSTQDIMRRYRPALISYGESRPDRRSGTIVWRMSPAWAAAMAVVAVLGVMGLTRVSEFIYFQF